MNVVVDGLMTNYRKTGKGRTIVCLPGWGDSQETFSKLAAELKDRYEVYALDLPGFGGTQAPPRAWNLQNYADFVISVVKKLKLNPYAVVGHSYGGAVAIKAIGSGLEADNLVLLASAGIRNKHSMRKKFLYAAAKTGKLPLYLLPADRRRKIRQKAYKSIGSDMTLLPHMEETFKKIIGEDMRDTAAALMLPALLVYGKTDKDTPPSDGRILNDAINGSVLEIIDAGHFLHQERPDEVARLIRGFLGDKN